MTFQNYGQEQFLRINLEKSETAVFESYLIKDDSNGSYLSFLKYEKELHAYKFDNDKNLKGKIVSSPFRKKYIHIIGHAFQDNEILIVLKNKRGNKLLCITYNFMTESSSQVEHSIPLMSEKFVQSFNIYGRCFVFTRGDDCELNRYEFKTGRTKLKHNINLKVTLSSQNHEQTRLSEYFTDYSFNTISQEIPKINNNLPQNLKVASSQVKMYEFEDGFIWTLDKYDDHTLMLDFSYPDFEPKVNYIPKQEFSEGGVKTNSYLFEDKIAQLVTSSKKLSIEIKTIANENKILKGFRFSKNENIAFKNTSIIQIENLDGEITEEFYDNTSKYLRKITDEATGLHVYKKDSTFVMTVGGIKLPTISSSAYSDIGLNVIETPENSTLSLNSTLYSTKQFSHTITTMFKTILNLDFVHVKAHVEKNIIERLSKFRRVYGMSAESLFYIDNQLIFGFNSIGINQFEFLKFN
jgi:hypothetical protein